MPNAVVSFGWEVGDLSNNGANVYFKVNKKVVLAAFDIDASFMITALTSSGYSEVLCQGSVSRQQQPAFSPSSGPSYIPSVASLDFGALKLNNPNSLNIVFNANLSQDLFYSAILKSFVPDSGAGASAFRHVHAQPALALNAGDYLVFHMDHLGVPRDAEMQVVLAYWTE